MFPDIRRTLFKFFPYHRPKSKDSVIIMYRNFYKHRFLENTCVQNIFKNINTKLTLFGNLLVKQCNAVAVQRLRRSIQIAATYRRLYGDHSLQRALSSFLKQYSCRQLFLLSGIVLFKWEEERIKDDELNRLVDDMDEIQHIEADTKHPVDEKGYLKSWEKVIDKDNFIVWRKPIPHTYLFEYKVYGTFYDVTPTCFFDIQIDMEYRKQWDSRVIKLEIVDKDKETNTEIIQWITHFPYPMYSREYVYKRRCKVDTEKNLLVMCSHAVDHPDCPVGENHVRVHMYSSTMVIKPHKTFDDNGFDYVMTYYDDPQASYTSFAYSWLAKTGVPKFVEELHDAARKLEDQRIKKGIIQTKDNNSNNNNNNRQYC